VIKLNQNFENKLLKSLLLFGIIALPFSLMGKNYKNWIITFLFNSYSNSFIAPILAKKNYLKYPVRIFPKYYQSSIIYDYLLCSLVSVWYCRVSQRDNWIKSFLKVWFFSFPQAFVERWLEKNTQLIKYNKGWTWIHSLLTITIAKLTVRSTLSLLRMKDHTKENL
jgi:hypothetical protein